MFRRAILFRRAVLVTIAGIVAISGSTIAALGWDARQVDDHLPSMRSPPTGRVLSAGRVTKVDIAAGKVTIEHRPIAHLHMEAMTMIFRVKDAAMLTALTPGDKIRFEVWRDNGSYIIMKIENSN